MAEIQEYRETQQRLLEQLESNATQIEKLASDKKNALRPFKDGVDNLMRVMTRKEITDVKQIVNEVFRLHKMVNSAIE